MAGYKQARLAPIQIQDLSLGHLGKQGQALEPRAQGPGEQPLEGGIQRRVQESKRKLDFRIREELLGKKVEEINRIKEMIKYEEGQMLRRNRQREALKRMHSEEGLAVTPGIGRKLACGKGCNQESQAKLHRVSAEDNSVKRKAVVSFLANKLSRIMIPSDNHSLDSDATKRSYQILLKKNRESGKSECIEMKLNPTSTAPISLFSNRLERAQDGRGLSNSRSQLGGLASKSSMHVHQEGDDSRGFPSPAKKKYYFSFNENSNRGRQFTSKRERPDVQGGGLALDTINTTVFSATLGFPMLHYVSRYKN